MKIRGSVGVAAVVGLVVSLGVGGGCATGGMSANQSNSDSGQSNGPVSDQSDPSRGSSDTNSESGGSSDSNSETSGTVTTRGNGPNAADATAVMVTTALVLVGASSTAGLVVSSMGHGLERVEAQRRDIRVELARGEGVVVREIGEQLGLSSDEVSVVGHVLKSNRVALDRWLEAPEPLTVERLRGFLLTLIGVLRAEPYLTARVDAVCAEVEQRLLRP